VCQDRRQFRPTAPGAKRTSETIARHPTMMWSEPLPAYSPELNPVERVWLYLKQRFLSHRLHADYEAIVEAACEAWSRLKNEA
jgi:transposase